MAEFSDLPMTRPPETRYDFYDVKYVADYLEKYIDSFKYDCCTIRNRTTFGVTVTKVENQKNKWLVHGRHNHNNSTSVYHASILMIASGLTSTPNMPTLSNQNNLKGQILHWRDLGQSSVLSSSDKYITVLGGAKSAADMVYASVKARKSVT